MNIFSILLYYLVLMPLSVMPFFILHALSRVMFFVLYYMVGYRKKVVMENIRNSFPEKTEKEHEQIAKGFYRYLGDLLLEGFKAFNVSERTLKKRLKINNPELINRYYDQGKSVIIAIGHYNCWELFLAGLDSFIKHKAVVIYQPLTDQFLDKKLNQSRTEHGTQLLPAKEVVPFFNSSHSEPTATVFAIDQSPANNRKCYWMTFLHQETGVLFGTEKFAKEKDQPVLYARINQIKRGSYSLDLELVTDQPGSTAYGEITEKVTRLLERDIQRLPEFWLWSHRRWKHKRDRSSEEQLKS